MSAHPGITERCGAFAAVSVAGQESLPILRSGDAVWRPFRGVTQAWPESILLGQEGIMMLRSGRLCPPRECLAPMSSDSSTASTPMGVATSFTPHVRFSIPGERGFPFSPMACSSFSDSGSSISANRRRVCRSPLAMGVSDGYFRCSDNQVRVGAGDALPVPRNKPTRSSHVLVSHHSRFGACGAMRPKAYGHSSGCAPVPPGLPPGECERLHRRSAARCMRPTSSRPSAVIPT